MSVRTSSSGPQKEANSTGDVGGTTSTVHVAVYAVFCLTLYAPFSILIYYRRRHTPSIRYRNPIEMTFTATCTVLYSFARFINTLYSAKLPCAVEVLITGLPLQTSFASYLMTKLKVVLTFRLTELMVEHVETKPRNKALLTRLHTFFQPKVALLFWVTALTLWNLPLVVLEVSHGFGDTVACPDEMSRQVVVLYCVEFGIMIMLSVYLSFHLSKAVDNFGLGKSFQRSSRIMFCLFCVAVPVSYSYDNAFIQEYAVDFFVHVVATQTFLWLHIVHPVVQSFTAEKDYAPTAFRGTAAILDAFLHTTDGYEAFTLFAKLEFSYASVVAWKNIVGFRLGLEHHLTAQEIFDQHLATSAPLPIRRALPPTVWKRYLVAMSKAPSEYAPHDAQERDPGYFDVLFDALVAKILQETLPRFQRHSLGRGWTPFVDAYNTQQTLDKLLLNQSTKPNELPSIKWDSYVRGTGRMVPILSNHDSSGMTSSPNLPALVVPDEGAHVPSASQ